MITTPDLLAAGPEIFLAAMGMVLMMVGVFSPEKRALGIVSGLTVASFTVVLAYYLFLASGERSVVFANNRQTIIEIEKKYDGCYKKCQRRCDQYQIKRAR